MEAIKFTPEALADLEYWKKSGNTIILKCIRQLLQAIQNDPFKGIGKPEPLKYDLSGHWSRRINHTHRVVYKAEENIITIYSLRYHYTH
jgi:toxin YoeB